MLQWTAEKQWRQATPRCSCSLRAAGGTTRLVVFTMLVKKNHDFGSFNTSKFFALRGGGWDFISSCTCVKCCSEAHCVALFAYTDCTQIFHRDVSKGLSDFQWTRRHLQDEPATRHTQQPSKKTSGMTTLDKTAHSKVAFCQRFSGWDLLPSCEKRIYC